MGNAQATEELLKGYPKLSRILGWCGLATIVLGYLATALGKASEVKRYLFELVGPHYLLSIHFGMSFMVVALFLVGYLTIGFWIYRRYLSQLAQTRRRRYLGALTACGLFLTGGSIYAALPPAPDVHELLHKESSSWERELLGLRVDGGGLRYNRVDHSVEPQVWSTAQSLWAILASRTEPLSAMDAKEIREHLDYIDRLRLPNDEGWGYMEPIYWGVTEIASWVALAHLASTHKDVVDAVWGSDSALAFERIDRDLRLLKQRQIANGGWAPIRQNDNAKFARTYSTVMALWAMIEAKKHPELSKRIGTSYDEGIRGGIRWSLGRYDNERRSWIPNPERAKQTDSFPGLTAHVLYVLERAKPEFDFLLRGNSTYDTARQAFMKSIAGDASQTTPALASRLASSNDRTHDSDCYLSRSKFMVEGSTFLWFPWAVALCAQVEKWEDAETTEREIANRGCSRLLGRINDLVKFARDDPFAYVMAESLFALHLQLAASSKPKSQ